MIHATAYEHGVEERKSSQSYSLQCSYDGHILGDGQTSAFGGVHQRTVSVSGAFHAEAGTSIFTTIQTGDFIIFQVYTLLSFVYLASNKEPSTTPYYHLAFTGRPSSSQRSSPPSTIDFNFAMTLYGDMKSGHDVRIPKTGSYMISLRPFIFGSRSLRFDLHVNRIL